METIQFKKITPDMFPLVFEFMEEHYLPDEPVCRSLGIKRNWMLDEFLWKDALKDGSSIAALDKEGKIIGVRLGQRMKRPSWFSSVLDKVSFPLPDWYSTFDKLMELVGYDVSKMFDQLGTKLIYEDTAVCSARGTGVKGLGTELCRRTEILAKELGCTHTYACVTGN